MYQSLVSPSSDSGDNLQRHYAVFISYKHADNKELGREWATWLHQTLETYEIPRDLVGTNNDHGGKIPESLYPVFRDEEELSAGADLSEKIPARIAEQRNAGRDLFTAVRIGIPVRGG